MDVLKANEMMLRSCGFVYIADRGSVIHANSLCGTGYNSLVPIDIALKYGYTRPCKTCACRTYVESLIRATPRNCVCEPQPSFCQIVRCCLRERGKV